MKNAFILIAYAGRNDDKLLDAIDSALTKIGGICLVLSDPAKFAVLEGTWPGGDVGFWQISDAADAARALAATGPWKSGSFAVLIAAKDGAALPGPGAGFLFVQGIFTDPAKAAAYNAALPPVYAKFEGYYLALSRADSIEHLAGEWEPKAMVIAVFDSVETVKSFWYSQEYTEAKKLRQGGGHFQVIAFSAN